MKFSALQLAEPIVRAVAEQGYTTPTPIQAGAIPPALEGRDILGTAQTGTGKTCAFAPPILQRLSTTKRQQPVRNKRHNKRARARAPRALILCPTRELATQIHESFIDYGRNLKLGYCVIYGGVNQYHQVRSLQRGVDVLVATPGRLKDLHDQGHIDLREIEVLVLDESDRMLDMGFIHDIKNIVRLTPADRQTMLFSATISESIRSLAVELLNDPMSVETAPESTTVDAVHQRFFVIPQQQKNRLLITLLKSEEIERVLVFTKTKHKADRVARWLRRANIKADAIHSNRTQSARNAAMRSFREGRVQVLVATDIASRGIDVDDVSHVINFDVPIDPETYVHRIGRTARAGASGTAITFVQESEYGMVHAIERRADITLPDPEPLPALADLPERGPDSPPPSETRDERRRDWNQDGDRRGNKKNTGRHAPRDDRDDRSGKPGHKKKFKKHAGGHNKGGYVPRDDRDDRSGKPGGHKKKFKKHTGGYNNGGYVPRDDRDDRSGKPGGRKKKFKKHTGGYNNGGYVPR
ncbi:MAG: DEAD/DEAH box helicase, partial [Phycisphaerae bacterium]|nr:DEAD/DEAH box helicase [Phycisphaerae bacterium]